MIGAIITRNESLDQKLCKGESGFLITQESNIQALEATSRTCTRTLNACKGSGLMKAPCYTSRYPPF